MPSAYTRLSVIHIYNKTDGRINQSRKCNFGRTAIEPLLKLYMYKKGM